MQVPMEIGGTGSSLLQSLRSGPGARPAPSPESGVAPRRVQDLSPHARGGPSFEYQWGPDGRRYAVGGEVHVDTAPVAGDPEATLRKMEQFKRAALAPAEPSPEDRQVAAEAAAESQKAHAELRREPADGAAGPAAPGAVLDLLA